MIGVAGLVADICNADFLSTRITKQKYMPIIAYPLGALTIPVVLSISHGYVEQGYIVANVTTEWTRQSDCLLFDYNNRNDRIALPATKLSRQPHKAHICGGLSSPTLAS